MLELSPHLKSKDPVSEFYQTTHSLRAQGSWFAIATIIEVIGSASARTGSKAIFNLQGENLLGWVGGGCAERFIADECLAALSDGQTRIVLADLDDEVFGLGVACGGKMRVFIEPMLPSPIIQLASSDKFQAEIRTLCGFYGWTVEFDGKEKAPATIEELILHLTTRMAQNREKSAKSLRDVKAVPAKFTSRPLILSKEVTIVGRTRITEALARHFTLLGFSVRAIGPGLKAEDYPATVACSCLEESYQDISFRSGEIVLVAGHTSQDPLIVEAALNASAGYVGMIGSTKRAHEVLSHLQLIDKNINLPLFIPAGLDMDARNPDEIALSVVAEVLTLKANHE